MGRPSTQYSNSDPIQPSAIALACLSRLAPAVAKGLLKNAPLLASAMRA